MSLHTAESPRKSGWALAALSAMVLWAFAAYAAPLVCALVLALASSPLQVRLRRKLGPLGSASLITAAWLFLVLLPVAAGVWIVAPVLPLVSHAQLAATQVLQGLTNAPLVGHLVHKHLPLLQAWLAAHPPQAFLSEHWQLLTHWSAQALRALLDISIALAAIFGLLLHHDEAARVADRLLARTVGPGLAQRLGPSVVRACQAVVSGGLVMAAWDALLGGAIFWISRMPDWPIWAIVLAVVSTIPGGTTALLALAAAALASQGHIEHAVFLFAAGSAVTLSGDWWVKPKWIGRASHAPFLLVLLAIFGGLADWGLAGVLLGPLVLLVAKDLLLAV